MQTSLYAIYVRANLSVANIAKEVIVVIDVGFTDVFQANRTHSAMEAGDIVPSNVMLTFGNAEIHSSFYIHYAAR